MSAEVCSGERKSFDLPPPAMIFSTSSTQSSWSISSASSRTVYLGASVSPALKDRAIVNLLDTTHGENAWAIHEITETTWCRDQDVTTLAKLLQVVLHRDTTVGASGAKHRAIAETTSLVEDLLGKFTGWHDNEHERLSAHAVDNGVVVRSGDVWARTLKLLDFAHQVRDDGNEVRGRLAGACLSDSDNILAREGCRDAVSLHGRGCLVTAALDVLQDDGVKTGFVELRTGQQSSHKEKGRLHSRCELA